MVQNSMTTFNIALCVVALASFCIARPTAAGSACTFPAASSSPLLGAFKSATATEWQRRAPQCSQLSDSITLNWGISGNGANAVITFVVRAKLPAGTRFFGLGLSDLGSMKGADIFLFRAQGTGAAWTLQDAYAEGFETPAVDNKQDLTPLVIHYGNNILTAAWERFVTPCDKQDVPIAPATSLFVIWAYGNTFGGHGPNHGKQEVIFYPNAGEASIKSPSSTKLGITTVESAKGENLQVLDVVFPPLTIPNKETSYFSFYFDLPSDKTYHIVRAEAVVGTSLLHHGGMQSCDESAAAKVISMPNRTIFDETKTPSLCQHWYLLGPGLTSGNDHSDWVAPPDAGLPMGTPTTRVVSIQLHYNNPKLLVGQVDQGSGMRLYYTSQLRKHNIGTLFLSQQQLAIQPGMASVAATPTICPSDCTKRFRQPVKLLSGAYHMHYMGKSAIVRRFRDGKELAPLDQLHAFDYNFATPRAIVNQTLLPGDVLSLQCTYDSTGRTNITTWGPDALDEMCIFSLMYYPAQDDMGYCTSVGTMPVALCMFSPPPEFMWHLTKKGNAADLVKLVMKFSKQGKFSLVRSSKPQAASSPYTPVCK